MTNNEIKIIKDNGELIAIGSSNWDFYAYNNILWSIPKENSCAGASIWCGVKRLRAHLYGLSRIRNSKSLIPQDWQVVNGAFLSALGIE